MNTATPPQPPPNRTSQVAAGRTLRMMRQAHGVSLREVARLAGISPSSLSRMERGEYRASAEVTERICDVIANLPARAAS